MRNKNILAVQNLLRYLDIQSLRSPEVVANLVRAFGLVQWGPPVFGDDEVFKNAAADMAGIYQTPDQIGKAMVYLSGFKIDSFLEVGVFQGGNFLFMAEYLRRFNPDIYCLGIDPTNFLNLEIRTIIDSAKWLQFSPVTSDQIAGMKFGLVFIDGDHSETWLNKDYENVGCYAKICMFHDIQETSCPGTVKFWKALKAAYNGETVEFLDHRTNIPFQGIGIVHHGTTRQSNAPDSSNHAI